MVSSEELNGFSCVNCGGGLRGKQRMYCSRKCRYAYWMRRRRHGADYREREDRREQERSLQRSREREENEDMNEEKGCQNCGHAPCREDFYYTCNRSDHNKGMKQRGQLLSPDYWIPVGKTGEVNKSGCHGCTNLRGTMLNVETNKTVAICIELPIQKAPHPSEGCDMADYSSYSPRIKQRRRRRRKKDNDR